MRINIESTYSLRICHITVNEGLNQAEGWLEQAFGLQQEFVMLMQILQHRMQNAMQESVNLC